ncbi:AAA family ATPase [Flavobacteriaceae bacterium]|nr:AAA family ATPase [Flavobacteriaceae bacterium]
MTEQELQEQNDHLMYMKSIEEECAIDINKKIEHPPVAISFKNKEVVTKDGSVKEFPIPIGTYGNFSFIQAPPKSMKTFFVSLLGSAFCNPDGDFTKGMSSFRGKKHFVHFDTEQGDWHSQRVFKRVEWMNKGLNLDFYHTFALRKIGYRDRIDFIQYYLDCMREEGKEIGLIVIDGIADLVSDANNLEESNLIVQKIMAWSTVYDCHIVTVIHSNFGSDKPTGHLGSFLEKKAETQIQLEKDENKFGCITVSCKRSRNTPFESFDFMLNENGLPKIISADEILTF